MHIFSLAIVKIKVSSLYKELLFYRDTSVYSPCRGSLRYWCKLEHIRDKITSLYPCWIDLANPLILFEFHSKFCSFGSKCLISQKFIETYDLANNVSVLRVKYKHDIHWVNHRFKALCKQIPKSDLETSPKESSFYPFLESFVSDSSETACIFLFFVSIYVLVLLV